MLFCLGQTVDLVAPLEGPKVLVNGYNPVGHKEAPKLLVENIHYGPKLLMLIISRTVSLIVCEVQCRCKGIEPVIVYWKIADNIKGSSDQRSRLVRGCCATYFQEEENWC